MAGYYSRPSGVRVGEARPAPLPNGLAKIAGVGACCFLVQKLLDARQQLKREKQDAEDRAKKALAEKEEAELTVESARVWKEAAERATESLLRETETEQAEALARQAASHKELLLRLESESRELLHKQALELEESRQRTREAMRLAEGLVEIAEDVQRQASIVREEVDRVREESDSQKSSKVAPADNHSEGAEPIKLEDELRVGSPTGVLCWDESHEESQHGSHSTVELRSTKNVASADAVDALQKRIDKIFSESKVLLSPSTIDTAAHTVEGIAAKDDVESSDETRYRRKSIDMKNQLRMERGGADGGSSGASQMGRMKKIFTKFTSSKQRQSSVDDTNEPLSRERRKSIDMKNQLRMSRQTSVGGPPGETGRRSMERRRSIDEKFASSKQRQTIELRNSRKSLDRKNRISIDSEGLVRLRSMDSKFTQFTEERRASEDGEVDDMLSLHKKDLGGMASSNTVNGVGNVPSLSRLRSVDAKFVQFNEERRASRDLSACDDMLSLRRSRDHIGDEKILSRLGMELNGQTAENRGAEEYVLQRRETPRTSFAIEPRNGTQEESVSNPRAIPQRRQSQIFY